MEGGARARAGWLLSPWAWWWWWRRRRRPAAALGAGQVLALESDPPYTVATIEMTQGNPPAADLIRRCAARARHTQRPAPPPPLRGFAAGR